MALAFSSSYPTERLQKHGKRAANKALKQTKEGPQATEPLECVEMDETTIDLIIIDDEDDLPIGRMSLVDGIDRYTRMPVGAHLGFEVSYYSAMECLVNMILPKDDTIEKYGTTNPWNIYGLPLKIVIDQGKMFNNKSFKDGCQALGINPVVLPGMMPHLKGRVERFFRSSSFIFQSIDGTTFSNIFARDDYKSEQLACIYKSEAERIFHIFLVDIYAQRFHQGIREIPARKWERALAKGFEPRMPGSKKELVIELGQLYMRNVEHYGIDIARLRYNSPVLLPLRLALKGEKTKIKIHPADLSKIYVFDPFENRYIDVPVLDEYREYVEELSIWKHKVILRHARHTEDKTDHVALGKAKRKIREIVKQAKDRKMKLGPRKRISRWNNAPDAPSLQQLSEEHNQPPKTPVLAADHADEMDEGWGIISINANQ